MARIKWKKCLITLLIFITLNLLIFYFVQPDDTDIDLEMVNQQILMKQKRATTMAASTLWVDPYVKDETPVKHFYSLKHASDFMNSINITTAPRIIIHYKDFERKLPNFIDKDDGELFMQSERNVQHLLPLHPEQLRGVIEVVPNATFQMDYTCGYQSDYNFVKKDRVITSHQSYHILAPLIIPMAFLFQHFVDGTLPKLLQAWEFVRRPEVKIILERPDHDNVYALLDLLGISPERVIWHRRGDTGTVYHADFMLMICVAPPYHPVLWKEMRSVLGVHDSLQVPSENGTIMLLTRAGAKLAGRTMLNQQDVEDTLRARYHDKLVVFHGKYNVQEAIGVFSKVKIMIGTHGGAFYNLNYASLNTTVIEIGPVLRYGREIHSLPHAIFWVMADMLGQNYWRIESLSKNFAHDMDVDLDKLKRILDIVDNG